MTQWTKTASLALAVLVSALVSTPVVAQEEELTVTRTDASDVGMVTVGIEAGLPLVLGVDASYRLDPSWRMGFAVGRLSGLTAIRAEAQRLFGVERRRSWVPSITVGAEQYFLEKDDREATPLGIHAAAGILYQFDSPLSFSARVGVLKTFSSSDSGDVRVFSVRNGYTSGMLNAALRFHF